MTQVVIDFPDSLFRGAEALAQKEKISIEQLITSALGEKIAALMTEDYLTQKAKRGSRDVFLSILDHAPDVDPAEEDKL
ncbi:toxin-antitoxin system HicB family antitoxin [Methylomonas paludis]|uniref:Toxin-antitoxin system HicB family antitoxin n=1 Tax=Methylomonas paludis TaxID=1173101 RepID=A0A975MLG0_9GAMM|nr:toxin-antitoxin system HicB family antitoxin [Methylomonas paludis]QWF69720.1 toxin-antitoxin system HicB family antitoxin [Methylomonas paludis]